MTEPHTPAPDGSAPRSGATPPPAMVQPYPGAAPVPVGGYRPSGPRPPAAAAPYPVAGPGGTPPGDPRAKTLAVIGFVLALVGIVTAFVPFLAWFAWVFLVAAFVLALIALISKKQGGKGLGIAALVISAVGWLASIVVAIASFAVVGAFGTLLDDVSRDRGGSAISPRPPEITPSARAGLAPSAADVAFGRDGQGDTSWWYVVVIDNPNPDYVFDSATISVDALDADGDLLDSARDLVTLLPGKTAVTGLLLDVGPGRIASLEVVLPDRSEGIPAPADRTGVFSVGALSETTTTRSTTVSGSVSGTFEEDAELVNVVVVARSPEGKIIGARNTFVDVVPSNGSAVPFDVRFTGPLPANSVFEATASF